MSLLLQITIFLGASLVLVPLLKRFGIATVLGYFFTGILLGPSVFNIASDPDDYSGTGRIWCGVPDVYYWLRTASTTAVGNA